MANTLILIENLPAAYGDALALHGLSLSLKQGETLALIGANGAGKSTLLKCICGLLRSKTGSVRYKGDEISSLPAHEIVRRGIALVPEGRRLFLIAAFPESALARRYRRRAIVAFVGCAAAVYALGWLLQGVFG